MKNTKVDESNKILIRREKNIKGAVLGVLRYKDLRLYTLESEKDIIPTGEYKAFMRESPSNGRVIELKNVKNRSYIQIHVGNYLRDTQGCILVGKKRSVRLPAVLQSKSAMKELLNKVKNKKIKVVVE